MGVTLNGVTTFVTDPGYLDGAKVLASRSELRDGRWDALKNTSITIIPKGSIAYKLALVAGGMADATISLAPKHEWDIAAGVALVHAAGGKVTDLHGKPILFNKKNTLLMNGVIAAGPNTHGELCKILEEFVDARL
jgi:myo-inositol-1(or 4)-monophosphatase